MRIGLIGAGVVGNTLARALDRHGYQVVAVSSRRSVSAVELARQLAGCQAVESPQEVVERTDLVFLTVPDQSIEPVARSIRWRKGMGAVHCSGAIGLDVLSSAASAGAMVGCFHPLQAFASPDVALRTLAGTTFAVDGDEQLVIVLDELARALGGRAVRIDSRSRSLYHASAVLVSNYLVTLLAQAAELWRAFGYSPEEAIAALLPLLRGTVTNLELMGLPTALTGPIARGDIDTVRRHLDALARKAPEVLPVYCELGLQTVPLGTAKGTLDEAEAEELRRLLSAGKSNRGDTPCG